MSSFQTVNFTDPAIVTQMQQTLNYGQSINSSVALPLIAQYINTLKAAPSYGFPSSSFPTQQGHKGIFYIGGNYLSDQTMFYSTGLANSAGATYTQDTLINVASMGKMVTGLVFTKMLEERIVKSSDRCYTYYSAMTGLGTYFNSIQLLNPATFPYSPSSWTGTTSTFNWATVTLSDLVHFSVGLPNEVFFMSPLLLVAAQTNIASIVQAYTSGVAQYGTGATSISGLGTCIQMNTLVTNAINNTNPTLAFQLFAGYTGSSTNVNPQLLIESTLQANINGSLPAIFPPGNYRDLPYPLNSKGIEHTYDSAYVILGVVLDKALRAFNGGATYPGGFAQYAREKLFTPLGMNDTYTIGVDTIPSSKISRLAENSWRRSPAVGGCNAFWSSAAPTTYSNITVSAANPNSWASFACSTGYANNMKSIMNLYTGTTALPAFAAPGYLAWNSEYPDDGVSRFSNLLFFCVTGTSTNAPIGNSPILTTPADFSKVLRMVGNRGYFNNVRILKSESWNYFISPKISAVENYNADYLGYGATDQRQSNSVSYCMGMSRVNRDLNNRTEYGYDTDTLLTSGATSVGGYVDLTTGNWFLMGCQELALSTGISSSVGSSPNNNLNNVPELIPRMIA